jgi:hypothetical protein
MPGKKTNLRDLWSRIRSSWNLDGTIQQHGNQANCGWSRKNRKKINSIIDITRLTDAHLKNLDILVYKISNIVTAMLQHNPAQLNSEINRILENRHEAATRITNMVQQEQNK